MPTSSLPNLAEILGPVLGRIGAEQRPLVIAAAERSAATRYRGWANAVKNPTIKAGLNECAAREDDIATRVEAMYPNAGILQEQLLELTPELLDGGRAIFSPYSLKDQFALQAQGERIGAATWRSYAARASNDQHKEIFLQCAVLEELSATFLESLANERL